MSWSIHSSCNSGRFIDENIKWRSITLSGMTHYTWSPSNILLGSSLGAVFVAVMKLMNILESLAFNKMTHYTWSPSNILLGSSLGAVFVAVMKLMNILESLAFNKMTHYTWSPSNILLGSSLGAVFVANDPLPLVPRKSTYEDSINLPLWLFCGLIFLLIQKQEYRRTPVLLNDKSSGPSMAPTLQDAKKVPRGNCKVAFSDKSSGPSIASALQDAKKVPRCNCKVTFSDIVWVDPLPWFPGKVPMKVPSTLALLWRTLCCGDDARTQNSRGQEYQNL
ncbi:uncharacterized protein [Dendrobates tinctorius]|uniref:uncharacterized protein isoform X2 n=1 Tax=Dendrobates tinctorius TaxID=92724 RepID=UPI003CC95D9D